MNKNLLKFSVLGLAAGLFLSAQAAPVAKEVAAPKKEAVAVEKKEVTVEKEVIAPKKDVAAEKEVAMMKMTKETADTMQPPCKTEKKECDKPACKKECDKAEPKKECPKVEKKAEPCKKCGKTCDKCGCGDADKGTKRKGAAQQAVEG